MTVLIALKKKKALLRGQRKQNITSLSSAFDSRYGEWYCKQIFYQKILIHVYYFITIS